MTGTLMTNDGVVKSAEFVFIHACSLYSRILSQSQSFSRSFRSKHRESINPRDLRIIVLACDECMTSCVLNIVRESFKFRLRIGIAQLFLPARPYGQLRASETNDSDEQLHAIS